MTNQYDSYVEKSSLKELIKYVRMYVNLCYLNYRAGLFHSPVDC